MSPRQLLGLGAALFIGPLLLGAPTDLLVGTTSLALVSAVAGTWRGTAARALDDVSSPVS